MDQLHNRLSGPISGELATDLAALLTERQTTEPLLTRRELVLQLLERAVKSALRPKRSKSSSPDKPKE